MSSEHIDRLNWVLDQADPVDHYEGLVTYHRYKTMMHRFAEHYGFPVERVIAVFCALSPNNDYKGNLKSMATVLYGSRAGWEQEEFTVTTYKACFKRAYCYLHGIHNFLDHCKGPKTRAFYQNILDPYDLTPVTIDGHMLSIWHDQRMTMAEAVGLRYRYQDVAQGVREVAFSRCLIPNQAQAMMWFTWKRLHRVVYKAQLNLFQDGDQWGNVVDPADVKPFARKPLIPQ